MTIRSRSVASSGLGNDTHPQPKTSYPISSSYRYLSEASFWTPEYFEHSAWIEHAPFAFWLVQMLQPRCLVELGTYNGFSYFAFCQVVKALGLNTQCYAVDHWKGDEHAGFYGNEVFQSVNEYNERHYAAFSVLVRSSFDEALAHFSDGSIDLLHIDGRHFYDDVKEDFESWRPKLSDRAVVLLHDTNVRERNFGVFRLWAELTAKYATFEFFHGHGLGVLGYGAALPEGVAEFFAATQNMATGTRVRQAYARLGIPIRIELDNQQERVRLTAKLTAQETQTRDLKATLAHRDQETNELVTKLKAEEALAAELTNELVTKLKAEEALAAELKTLLAHHERETYTLVAKLKAQISQLKANLAQRNKGINSLRTRLAATYASRSWRITAPFRQVLRSVRGVVAQLQGKRRSGVGKLARSSSKQSLTSSSSNERPTVKKMESYRLAYQDLIIRSLFKPKITPPYSVQDKYLCSFMASHGIFLQRLYKDKSQPNLISIILPTFNRENSIADAIQSVLCQTYRNWELLIVDDCSSDSTAAIVAALADPKIKYIRLDTNRGPAGARNAGLEKASGDFVTYLDSDNTIDPNFLLILSNELQESPLFDAVYCAQRAFRVKDGRTEEAFVRFAPFHRPSLENKNYIDLGVLMHRRSVLDNFGKFNAAMRKYEDWEFILRCTADKLPKPVPVILSTFYFGKTDDQVRRTESSALAVHQVDALIKGDPVPRSICNISLTGAEQVYSLSYKVPRASVGKPVSIIIPSFEAEPYLRACIEAILAFSDQNHFEIIVVDNASSVAVVKYLEDLANENRIKVIFNERNFGFSYAVNQGIAAAHQEHDLIIVNNDALVTRGWIDAFQAVLCEYPDTGLVMPAQIVLPRSKRSKSHQPYRNPSRECDINISAHHDNVLNPLFDIAKGYMELAFAPFFCVYVPRSTLQLAGLLDVVAAPHYYSDNLYCDLVRGLGKRIIYTPHCKVYHFVKRATAELKDGDAELYKKMFVTNDWTAITSHKGEPGAGPSHDSSAEH